MSIKENEVVIGGIYATINNQLRRVINIENGKVSYMSKGGNVNNNWTPGHAKATPPSLENFASACDRIISNK